MQYTKRKKENWFRLKFKLSPKWELLTVYMVTLLLKSWMIRHQAQQPGDFHLDWSQQSVLSVPDQFWPIVSYQTCSINEHFCHHYQLQTLVFLDVEPKPTTHPLHAPKTQLSLYDQRLCENNNNYCGHDVEYTQCKRGCEFLAGIIETITPKWPLNALTIEWQESVPPIHCRHADTTKLQVTQGSKLFMNFLYDDHNSLP